ncbi:MAG TPA: hypothetical protein PLO67_06050 [Saprospiraceae bacterium]|nr:hypothetical protein [Saprospiraceae bacterium]HPI05716.1 hypothetical protein [Saprospiraceae bacterium]
MVTIDFYSGFIIVLTFILVLTFFWHANWVLRNAETGGSYRQKDSDDYVLGKKYNEDISSLDSNLKITRDRIVSFLGVWKVAFFLYFLVCTATLYIGYTSKMQLVDRVKSLEDRVKYVEERLGISR